MTNGAPVDALDKVSPEEAGKHVTIWNRHECRKIAGNAAPLRRNLHKYLKKHPECEVYDGQDKDPHRAQAGSIDPITGETVGPQNEHVPMWHKLDRRKVTGNAAPLKKNLQTYLRKHPECEVYNGQDKRHHILTCGQSVLATAKDKGPGSSQFAPVKPPENGARTPCSCRSTSSVMGPNDPGFTPIGTASGAVGSKTPLSLNVAPAERNHGSGSHSQFPLAPETLVWFNAMQQHQDACAHKCTNGCKNDQDVDPPLDTELSYKEMVSSWSNHPTWCSIFANPSFHMPSGGQPPPISFPSENLLAPKAIPIPGRILDHGDCFIGTSCGTSIGAPPTDPKDVAYLLDDSSRAPQSVDMTEPMDFSPSHYLKMSVSPQQEWMKHLSRGPPKSP